MRRCGVIFGNMMCHLLEVPHKEQYARVLKNFPKFGKHAGVNFYGMCHSVNSKMELLNLCNFSRAGCVNLRGVTSRECVNLWGVCQSTVGRCLLLYI